MFDDFKNAFQRTNNGHVQLIIINVTVFLALGLLFVFARILKFPDLFNVPYEQFTLPSTLSELAYRPWTMLTYSFAHYFSYEPASIGFGHIFFNMLGFYWFARLFVEYLGSDKLIALYVLGALAGGAAFLVMVNTVPYFQHGYAYTLVGASAAVFAVMTAAATLLPDHSFFLMFIGPIKIKYIAGIYIVISLLSSASGQNEGGNIAHLGGALMGFVYIKQLQSGRNLGQWITTILYWIKGLFQGRRHVKVSYRKTGSSARSSKQSATASQEEIDTILDKISDRGYDSLSREEKEKLFNASKK